MFAYFSKLNNLNKLNKLKCVSLLLLNNYDNSDASNIEDDEYLTIARWAKEYNFMIMHPYNIVVREDIPPLFSYS